MFSYCTRSFISITSTLGNYLSNKVSWFDDNGQLYDVETINNWSRIKIAEDYVSDYILKYDKELDTIGGEQNKDIFLKELAIKIDEFIPKRYFCKYNELHSNTTNNIKFSSLFKGKDEHDITRDLIYTFDVNNNSLYKYPDYATDSQLKLLKDLLHWGGYILKSDNLTFLDAFNLINFLSGDSQQPDNLFELVEFDI